MKRLILLALPSSLLATEVVVYSPPSESPLHVSAVSGAPRAAFAPSYTGHRSVCVVPGASASDAFVAWTGGDAYRVGDPFGCSTGRDSCAVELEPVSAIMPRFDLFTGAADRVRTVQDVYDKIIADIMGRNLSPDNLEKALADVAWMASNRVEMVTVPRPGEEVRVRVVRWLVDGKIMWRLGVTPKAVVDKRFEYREGAVLTEADVLSDTCFDLDWDDLAEGVVMNRGVRDEGLPVSDMCYLVVLGDGKVSYRGMSDTNTVNAFPNVIWRRYGTNHVQAVAIPSGAQPLSHPLFRFRADCPALERYTACQLQVTSANGSVTNWTSGTVRIPPRDATGAYVYSAPDLSDTGISTNGTYSWRAIVYNSKFNERAEGHGVVGILKWSEPVPIAFTSGGTQPASPPARRPAEAVVYSRPSESPLRIANATAPTSVLAKFSPPQTFPKSYTGHRAVCRGAFAGTNAVAWTGGDAYRVGDPFGCSTGRDSCAVELEPVSAIMPRFDLFTGAADRVRTVQDVYDKIISDILNLNLSPSSLERALADVAWMASNRIEMVTVPKPGEEARVRVVRWLVDGKPVWRCGVYPRAVVDKRFEYREGAVLTEADILSDTCFDLDWEDFGSVVTNLGVRYADLTVNDVCYLVVLGDGKASYGGMNDTNTVVNAFPKVIWRRYGTNHVQAVALPSGAQPLSHPLFRFRADCPALERYTACQLQVTSANGSVTNWTSGTVRIPPRDATGAYVYSAPDLGDTGISTNGTYSWRAIVYNSKFNEEHFTGSVYWSKPPELKWSDPAPVTFTANE